MIALNTRKIIISKLAFSNVYHRKKGLCVLVFLCECIHGGEKYNSH